MKVWTVFFKADEKGMEYPPEFSNLCKGVNDNDKFIEIALEENEKTMDR